MTKAENQGRWGGIWEIYQVRSRRRMGKIQREELGSSERSREIGVCEDWATGDLVS